MPDQNPYNLKFIATPYIYILIFLNFNLYAQNLVLKPVSLQPGNQNIFNGISYKKLNSDEKELYLQIDSIKVQLQKKGYLQNKVKDVKIKDSIYSVVFQLNKRIEKIRIYYTPPLPEDVLQLISNKKDDSYFEIPFDQLESTMDRIVSQMESSGYSFVQVYLKNIRLEESNARSDLIIENSLQRTIDGIMVKPYEKFPEGFIKYRQHLKKGSPFNLQKLENASINTKSIGFVQEIKPPEVLFTGDSTFIYLFLEKRKSNSFDGLIGFSSKTEDSGLDLNGYLDVKLRNIFDHGENISLFWKSNGNNSQQFDLNTQVPYVFNTPFTPELSLNIYKQDTTFINTNFNISVYFDILKNAKIAALFNAESSTDIRKITTVETINSYKKNKYGINFKNSIFRDDQLFPEKFTIDANAFYATRKTDSENSDQAILTMRIHYLWEISSRNYLFIQNQSGMINSKDLYTNELFRIGGINSVRGFNEENIPASAYSIINMEYRYKTNQESYFYALSDMAWFKDQISELSTGIFGFGLGYSFLTKAGRLDLIYALGKFKTEPFNFYNSKLHFKIVNYF